LGRRPEAVALCRELGLEGELEPIGSSGAAVWARGRLRTLPAGLALGVPTRFWPVATSGILGPAGSLRLLADAVVPRPDLRRPMGDRALGPLLERKLGHRVVEALADPMIGGIHAGSVVDMSTAANFPLLLAVSQGRGGLMRNLRRALARGARPDTTALDLVEPAGTDPADRGAGNNRGARDEQPSPAFWAMRNGMGSLVDGLSHALRGRGVELRTGAAVINLVRTDARGIPWSVQTSSGELLSADGIVLATPAPSTASLLADLDSDASAVLRGIQHASVGIVTLSYSPQAFPSPLEGTGLLVPKRGERPRSRAAAGDFLVTACTFLSIKWPHLARGGQVLIRASVGRFGDQRFVELDDDTLVQRVIDELGVLLEVSEAHSEATVTRWIDAFPQYQVHHLLRVAAVEAAAGRLPGLAVAGRTYRGVGIPACIASGRAAARRVLDALDGPTDHPGAKILQ